MGLKIVPDGKGGWRDTWYARFTRNGQKVDVNLRVPIRGTVPVDSFGRFDRNAPGDVAFAKSRKEAWAALDKMQKGAKTTGDSKEVKAAKTATLAADYYRARTGVTIKTPMIAKLADFWQHGMMRTYTPTAERVRAAKATFKRFADFTRAYCAEHGGKCERIGEITPEIATAFFKSIFTQYAWGTVKDQMSLLSGTYAFAMGLRAQKVNGAIQNPQTPFNTIIKRNRETGNAKVERKPLSERELERLFDVTGDDPGVHDLVVCAACTGMRIGDVCNLTWADVDLRGGFIDCVTAKAGVRVTIPIFDPLRPVLQSRFEKCAVNDSPYVFPLAAAKYNHVNPRGFPDQRTGLVRMVKPYFARAVFNDAETPAVSVVADGEPKTPADVATLIDGARFTPAKKARLREVFERLTNGEKCNAIADAMKIARGQVSDYLRELETLTGETYRPRAVQHERNNTTRELMKRTRVARKIGKRSASLYGWHNLRHTFVVLALQNGVPAADVKTIVGHGDVETTLTNYNNPTKEVVAERVRKRMAGTVIGGATMKRIGETVDVAADDCAVIPADGGADAGRLLAIARAVLSPDEAARVDAVIAAAGMTPDAEPGRVLALIGATVDAKTKRKIAAVIKAAGA